MHVHNSFSKKMQDDKQVVVKPVLLTQLAELRVVVLPQPVFDAPLLGTRDGTSKLCAELLEGAAAADLVAHADAMAAAGLWMGGAVTSGRAGCEISVDTTTQKT